MIIRLFSNISQTELLAEVMYDVRPRSTVPTPREIILAGAVVGTYSYDIDAVKGKSKQAIKVCLYSDTIEKVREYAEHPGDGKPYLIAIRMNESFGIMIAHEKLGLTVPDFTVPVVSIRRGEVGRMPIGSRRVALNGLDEAMLDEVIKIDTKSFKVKILPEDTHSDKILQLPGWGLFLEEQENENDAG